MARIEESVEIKCPVERVFTYTTDAKTWSRWQSIIPEAEQTSQGAVGESATFKGIARLMGLSMKWTAEVTEYEKNKYFGKNITSAGMFIEQHNTYDPIGGGVRFTIRYDIRVRWFFKLFLPVMVSSMRKELKKSLGSLKSILELQT